MTVAEAVMVEATGDQFYTMGTEIPALTLPAATGGTGTLTYALTGPNGTDLSELPAGLMWTGDTTNLGTIIGTPTAITTSPVTLTYTATDENGSTDSETLTLTVAAQVAVTAPTDQFYTMGITIPDLTLQAASGGTGKLTYTLTDPDGKAVSQAVPDLTFDGESRTLSGKLTAAGTSDLTYTATDENGSTDSATFTVTVAVAVGLTDTDDQFYTMGTEIPALTLPAATDGTGTLTYTLRDGIGNDVDTTDNAVPGLTFDGESRVLSGIPTTAATTALTYTATDENGSTDSVTFTVTVAAAVALTDTDDQAYTMGTEIPDLTLPAATGGTGTLTYTLRDLGGNDVDTTDNAVPGLAFDDESRVLSGTPTTATTTALTYTVTDQNGSTTSDTVTLTVAAQVVLNAPPAQTYTMGHPIPALTLPAATGGTGTLTYTLTGPSDAALSVVVPGLTFTATTHVLTGTPTTQPTTDLTYTVTDQNGSTDSATFSITVADGVAVNAPNAQTYTIDQTITALTLPTATGGTGTLTYTLRDAGGNDVDTTDNAVPGLSFDNTATVRTLTGTPTTQATTDLTYTVTDQNGSASSVTFNITVADVVALTDTGDQTYTMGQTITALTLPAATGGTAPLTYTLRDGSGNAVPGLAFNTTTRVLFGTPTTAATTPLIYTVTDDNGSIASKTFTVTVAAAVALTDTGDQFYTMGRPITALTLPAATGGTGTLTYTLTGPSDAALSVAVPGLAFDDGSRVLSGTPTTAVTTVLTYTVTDERGSTASDTVTLTVAAQVALNAPNNQTYTMGTEIPALTLPLATGGTGTLTYTLTGPSDAALSQAVPGLTFTATTRVLSGTPTTVATTVLTYTVTDDNGSTAEVTLTLTVAAQVAVTDTGDQTYTMGTEIPALTLPAATGGTGTLTYTLTGSSDTALSQAVPGLTFTATTRVLSGTPTTVATTVLTYTVTDQNGSTASATLTLTVAAQVAVTDTGDQTYTMGTEIPALTLPAATGGTGTLTYTLRDGTGNDVDAIDNAVPGLTFDPSSRVLSGTPTTVAITALTYTVTDQNGSTDSDTVTLTVAAQVAVTAPNNQTYTMGTEIPALTLPAATGGTGTLTYTLRDGTGNDVDAVDNAVPGLTFNTTSRVLSGTPTTAATTALTYTVTDQNGSTDSATLTLTVAAQVRVTAPNNQTYTMGTEIPALTLPAATGGTGTLTYTLTGPASIALSVAVPGLTFTATTRVLSGTPATVPTIPLTYTVTDQNGSTASVTFTVTVAARVAVTAPGDQTYTMGTEIPALTLPTATGGTAPLTYTLTGPNGTDLSELPAGLMWTGDATNPGTITGEPTTGTTSPVTLTYTATDQNGSTDSETFTVTVAAAVALADTGDQTYTMGTTITDLPLPAATGGTGTLTYTLTGPNGTDLSELPAGLMWTGDTTNPGTITGMPTAITASPVTLTYTVTDENGSTASDTFTVTVAAAVALADTGDQAYTMGAVIPALTLPAATGGTGTLTYTLRDGTGNDVDTTDNAVPGLTFTATTRVLSGTPTTAATTALIYTVTDENGSTASDTLTLTVAAAVALADTGDQTYTMGTEMGGHRRHRHADLHPAGRQR